MKLSWLMMIKSLLCWLAGLTLLIIPTETFSTFGISLDAGGVYIVRILGAGFILLAMLLGLARNVSDETTSQAFAISNFVGDIVAFVVALLSQLAGVTNSVGWIIVIVYLLLAVGFGYYELLRFAAPQQPQATGRPL